MPSPNAPGRPGPALVARDPPLDLRPILLRVHTDLFVTAPVRDRGAIEAFEALVTGLLPSVDDATAAVVARKLTACPDAPPALLAALEGRGGTAGAAAFTGFPPSPDAVAAALSGHALLADALAGRSGLTAATLERLLALDNAAVDLALAGNRRLPLAPAAVAHLVRKARLRPALAEELLPRPELTALDRATLYLHAGPERRAHIRAEVAGVAAPAPPRLEGGARETLLALARRGEEQAFERHLEALLGCGPQDWRFDDPWRHDLLGLALLAAGLNPDDAIRAALSLPASLARSGPAVLRFATLVHRTTGTAAGLLLEASLGFGGGVRRAGAARKRG